MSAIELRRTDEFAWREARPAEPGDVPPVLLLHGYPESSRMWVPAMEALAASGRRCLAPDLYGLGDSPDDGPATFERNLEALTRFVDEHAPGRLSLAVHDWGGFVGLAWACDHADRVAALVISDTGFFSDGKWHGVAEAMRSEQAEELIGSIDRDGFAGLLNSSGAAFEEEDVDAYWAPFETGRGQRSTLAFYRSMDFSKLARWDGRLAELGSPTLLLWGENDPFAPLAGARRFERELPGSHLTVIVGAGHFVYDEEPQRCAEELVRFLDGAGA